MRGSGNAIGQTQSNEGPSDKALEIKWSWSHLGEARQDGGDQIWVILCGLRRLFVSGEKVRGVGCRKIEASKPRSSKSGLEKATEAGMSHMWATVAVRENE